MRKPRTKAIAKRKNLVNIEMFARPCASGCSMGDFLSSLPDVLAAGRLRELAAAIVAAREKGKPIIFAMGGHVIKCGLAPVLIDLAQKGFVTAFAGNGSVAIHDFEIAMVGETSEDVEAGLKDGSFGMSDETGRLMNAALKKAAANGVGAGNALGRAILDAEFPHKDKSLLAAAARLSIPFTIHVSIGCDVIHQHPDADGAAIGAASFRDFRIFSEQVAGIGEGGVFVNAGSAVVMPEVFLKALSMARNAGKARSGFTTANLDMIRHYRPTRNVIERPTAGGAGEGISLIGHHEIMIPLLACAIMEISLKDAGAEPEPLGKSGAGA